jgi:hypothetical protein
MRGTSLDRECAPNLFGRFSIVPESVIADATNAGHPPGCPAHLIVTRSPDDLSYQTMPDYAPEASSVSAALEIAVAREIRTISV